MADLSGQIEALEADKDELDDGLQAAMAEVRNQVRPIIGLASFGTLRSSSQALQRGNESATAGLRYLMTVSPAPPTLQLARKRVIADEHHPATKKQLEETTAAHSLLEGTVASVSEQIEVLRRDNTALEAKVSCRRAPGRTPRSPQDEAMPHPWVKSTTLR